MKTKLGLLIFMLFFGCPKNPDVQKLSIDKMSLEVEVIPETTDGGYAISWKDTLCSAFNKPAWRYLEMRPYELYCYITTPNRDTLGYYRGLSSPRQFAYFQVKAIEDSIVNVKFLVGINHFSEFLGKQNQDYVDQFNKNNKERIEFEEVQLNLNKILRKKMRIELIKENESKK